MRIHYFPIVLFVLTLFFFSAQLSYSQNVDFEFMFGWGVDNGVNEFQICASSDIPCQAGILGGGTGQFRFPQGIAFDSMNNQYIVDQMNHRIQVFDSAGNFIYMFGWGVDDGTAEFQICSSADTPCQAGINGGGAGQFANPQEISIDVMNNIYVADTSNQRIQVFDSAGNFIYMFGWGVDDGTAEFQICSSADIPCQSGLSGSGAGQFNNPFGVTVDNMKNIYVVDAFNHRVQVFDSAGSFLYMFGWGVDDGTNEFSNLF